MQIKINPASITRIFAPLTQVIAVYLFGSYLNKPEQARDVDLAVLLQEPVNNINPIYMTLYPQLEEIFSPLEVDLLFLNSVPLPMAFEVISTGRVIYCTDEDLRTDFEYVISGFYMDYDYHLRQGRRELFEAIKETTTYV